MARDKLGVAVAGDLVDGLDESVEEWAALGASRSEIVEAILTAYFDTDEDRSTTTRELIVRLRQARQN